MLAGFQYLNTEVHHCICKSSHALYHLQHTVMVFLFCILRIYPIIHITADTDSTVWKELWLIKQNSIVGKMKFGELLA